MPIPVIHAPRRIVVPDIVPLLFEAGPIQGAPDWQNVATEIIESSDSAPPYLHIANPRRPEPITGKLSDKEYREQVDWEKAGLRRAAKHGGLIFWFAERDETVPYDESREYAKTTKKELFRALGWKDEDPGVSITIGAEPGFKLTSDRYLMTCIEEHRLPVYERLETVCMNALKGLRRRV